MSGTIDETASRGLTREDSVAANGKSASGAIRGGSDEYAFTGDLLRFELAGEATVLLNGEELDESAIQNPSLTPLTIQGSGERADYEFTVTGDLEGAGGLTGEDSIEGRTATGAVGNGQDSYLFSGEITSFTLIGSARVLVDGEEYTPDTGGSILRDRGIDRLPVD